MQQNCNTKRNRTYLDSSQTVCPVCGSNHIQSISRITGYLSFDERFGSGKAIERMARVSHNDTTKKLKR